MSLVIPPGFASASIVLTGPLGTAPYVTTIGLDLTDAGANFVGAANLVFNAYATHFMSTTNEKLTLSKVTLLVGSDGGNGSVDSTEDPVEGGNGSAMQAIAMAPIVRKQTPSLGRSGRGRMFLPGCLGELDVNDNGQLEPAFREGLADAASDFLVQLESGVVPGYDPGPPCPPVLLHAEGVDLLPSSIIAASISPQVGWIRKRLR